MHLSRIVIKGYRSLGFLDIPIAERSTCIIGENNTGKSNLIQALRICLDSNFSSTYRLLLKDDIHCDIDQKKPFQVLIGVEFTGFQDNDNEVAMLHGTQIGDGRARIFYRFRPKRHVREELAAGDRPENSLTLADYAWEIVGGGDPAKDLTAIEWNHENDSFGASPVGLQYLQAYLIVYLHALRDVQSDLQQFRRSPLVRLIEANEIDEEEQEALTDAISAANRIIEESPTIKNIGHAIDTSFKNISGPAFSMDVNLGLTSPSFNAIVRGLNLLLSSDALKNLGIIPLTQV